MTRLKNIYDMSPENLADALVQEFVSEIPEKVETLDEMKEAGRLLGKLTNQQSYLDEISMQMKIMTRKKKRAIDKTDKSTTYEWEDMVDRQYCVEKVRDIISQQYKAVSKMITTKIEINNELKMTDGK